MKHLKKFNEATNIDILKDILLELEDMGIGSNFYSNKINRYIDIHGYNFQTIYWDDVKDCILRLKKYLGKNYKQFIYGTFTHIKQGKYISAIDIGLELNEDTYIGERIRHITIIYTL